MNIEMRNRLRERLDEKGLSPRAASLKAGLNTHFLQKFFASPEKSITTDNLLKLCKALDTSPEWLLAGRGDKEVDRETREIARLVEKDLTQESRAEVLAFAQFKAEADRKKTRPMAAEPDKPKVPGKDEG